ncbi:hypothetical protein E1B28_004002 [Marasmius oreades]|uniref:Uncharacterized protein n=1 Tax=Marasmius oreades TaxID=181124 RepID=A0A9P8ACI0_9AGAR|nr:uncharacterized protein E1B28_004002 [Marasmius oreades]KAG7096583.1 hypothetical protein E1B28_004002 [Marasmius oreades]
MFSRRAIALFSNSTRPHLTPSLHKLPPIASLHSSSASRADSKHTSESYNKDVDVTPPDDSSIHRVDPGSGNVQKPHEPPAGKYSETGVDAAELQYQHVSKSHPYKAPGQDRRYGGREEKQAESSKAEDGPTGKAKDGMKPEGR